MARATTGRKFYKRIPRLHIPAFRIFYNGTYTVLLLLLFALLSLTPADHIYQTISNQKLGNVFVVAGTYFATGVIALFIFASRLYTNRTALAAIPRSYLPIAKGEVAKTVWREIVRERERSALVAWEGHPRDLGPEIAQTKRLREVQQTLSSADDGTVAASDEKRPHHHLFHRKHHRAAQVDTIPMQTISAIRPAAPPWGTIAHPGWTPPGSPDMPSLHFQTVLFELPNLLEAQAVALAPPDPAFNFLTSPAQDTPLSGPPLQAQIPADPAVVAAVQRQREWGMREYLGHLLELGVVDMDDEDDGTKGVEDFLRRYEYARYTVEALTESEFRDLMTRFSALLAAIVSIEDVQSRVPSSRAGDRSANEDAETSSLRSRRSALSDAQSAASSSNSVVLRRTSPSTIRTVRPAAVFSVASSSSLGDDDTGSVLHHTPGEEEHG